MSQQLGDVINQARRARRWSLRQLAAQVHKEDGTSISPQYLNDIELNRRIPAPYVLRELTQLLELDEDHMLMLAGGGKRSCVNILRHILSKKRQLSNSFVMPNGGVLKIGGVSIA